MIARDAGSPISAVIATLVPGAAAVDVAGQPLHHALGVGDPPGAHERHDGVEVVEDVPRATVGASRPGVGERREPAAVGDAVEAQAPEQRAGVDHLEGHALGLGVVDLGVVDAERVVDVTAFEVEEREVPPVVDREEVAGTPVGLALAEEPDAVGHSAAHLVGVDHGVDRPHVVGVDGQRGEPRRLGLAVAARLLEAERLHAADHGGVRVLGVQGEQGPARTIAEVGGVAEEEVEQVADLQGEQIRGPAHEQLVQDAGRTDPVAAHPRRDGVVVGLLPLVHRGGGHALEGPGRHGDVGLIEDVRWR